MATQAFDENIANPKRKPSPVPVAPTIATATAPPPVTPQVKQDFSSYFGPVRQLSDATPNPASPPLGITRTLSSPGTALPAMTASSSRANVMGAMVNGVRSFSDGSGSAAATMAPRQLSSVGNGSGQKLADGYYGNPHSPGYNSGIGQIQRTLQRQLEDNAVIANPVGPPARVAAPANMGAPGVRMNPTATDLAREGALRPESGPWSAANPQPMLDGTGRLLPARAMPPASGGTRLANFSVDGTEPAARAQAPTIATVTPQTAANAGELRGVARSLSNPAAPVRSDGGRLLGYGQVVNGVRTFSDGSGGPTAPPRTMSDADIANLGKEGRLSRADAGIGGNIASLAFRSGASLGGGTAAGNVLAGTPELGSAAGYALSRTLSAPQVETPSAYGQARADNIEAQRMTASDASSIVTRDTRSALGRAARAADIDARSSFGTKRERAARYAAATSALDAAAGGGLTAQSQLGGEQVRSAGALAQESMRQAGDTARANLNAQAEIARAFANRPAPTQVPLADGTLGLLGQDGTVRSATDAWGNAVRPRNQPSAEEIKTINDHARLLLGVDKDSGLKRDGTPPTARELRSATAAARAAATAMSEAQERMQQQMADDQTDGEARQQASMQQNRRFTVGQEYVDANGRRARFTDNGWEPV